MPYINVEIEDKVDIDVDEFLSSCSKREIEDVIEYLIDHEYLSSNIHEINEFGQQDNLLDYEWKSAIEKLHNIRRRIKPEDERLLLSIINKY